MPAIGRPVSGAAGAPCRVSQRAKRAVQSTPQRTSHSGENMKHDRRLRSVNPLGVTLSHSRSLGDSVSAVVRRAGINMKGAFRPGGRSMSAPDYHDTVTFTRSRAEQMLVEDDFTFIVPQFRMALKKMRQGEISHARILIDIAPDHKGSLTDG